MKRNKIQEIQAIIKDLSEIIIACDTAIKACKTPREYNELKTELVITYEERERQYKKLEQMEMR